MRYMDWMALIAGTVLGCLAVDNGEPWYHVVAGGILFSLGLGLFLGGMGLLLRYFMTPAQRPTKRQCIANPVVTVCIILASVEHWSAG
jgi:cytochrome c biogenesis protein CcdA